MAKVGKGMNGRKSGKIDPVEQKMRQRKWAQEMLEKKANKEGCPGYGMGGYECEEESVWHRPAGRKARKQTAT